MTTFPTSTKVNYWSGATGAAQWDTAYFTITGKGTFQLPGLAAVDAVWERDWQVAKNQGDDISYVSNKGLKPRRFTMRLRITDYLQFQQFLSMVEDLDLNGAGKKGAPIGFGHPYASMLNVQFVVIEKLDLPPPNSKDAWVTTFRLLEWAPQPVQTQVQAPATFGQTGLSSPISGPGAIKLP